MEDLLKTFPEGLPGTYSTRDPHDTCEESQAENRKIMSQPLNLFHEESACPRLRPLASITTEKTEASTPLQGTGETQALDQLEGMNAETPSLLQINQNE